MRLLYWAELHPPSIVGGVEVSARATLRGLRDRGIEPLVVCNHGHDPLPHRMEVDGIPVHRFHFHQPLIDRDLPRIQRAVAEIAALKRAFAPDVIQVHTTQASVFFHLRTASAHPCPWILHVREALPDAPAPHTLAGQALERSTWISTVSGAILEDVRRWVPEAASRSCAILEALPAPPPSPDPGPESPPLLLAFGRLDPVKGFDTALRAFALILEELPAARLAIAGRGREQAALEALARDLGVAGRVEFTGWLDPEDIPALIRRSALVLIPSRWREAFGQTALQAAQQGRPAIACRTGGLAEIIEDGRTGLLVDIDDAAAMARAATRLLKDPAACRSMGEAARIRAREVFDFERMLDAHAALLRRVAGTGKNPIEGAGASR